MSEPSSIEKAFTRIKTPSTTKPMFTIDPATCWGGSFNIQGETIMFTTDDSTHYLKGAAAPPDNLVKDPDHYVNDPSANYDNVASLEAYLKLLDIPFATREIIIDTYRIGFYKVSDGKSHPLPWLRIPSFMKALGLEKDPVSVVHDRDYYRGFDKKDADLRYYRLQIAVGLPKWRAWIEYYGLKMFGGRAYRRHAELRRKVGMYGTDTYVFKAIRFAEAHPSDEYPPIEAYAYMVIGVYDEN